MRNRTILFLLAMLLCLLLVGLAVAAVPGWDLDWWTAEGGGDLSQGGEYALQGSIGQADAGRFAGGAYRLDGGFWGGAASTGGWEPQEFVCLPLIVISADS